MPLSRTPPKKRKWSEIDDTPKQNPYYMRVSRRYRWLKYFVLLTFIVYILGMIVFYRDDITMENFRYMMKFIDTKSPDSHAEYREVSYEADTEMKFGIYKGDLAVVGQNAVTLYNSSGESIMKVDGHYINPIIRTSSKYMLVYDLGEKNYALYNSFSKLYNNTMEYPITNATVSDSGTFAIVSKTKEYRSAVYVYDKNFNEVSRILKDKYVMDVDIAKDGKELLLTSVYAQDGYSYTDVLVYEPGKQEAKAEKTIADFWTMQARYQEKGGYVLVGYPKILFFNKKSEPISEYNYGDYIPNKCLITKDYTIVCFNKNAIGNENVIMVFNQDGEVIFNQTLEGKIVDLTANESFVFLLFDGKINRISIKTGQITEMAVEKNCIGIHIKEDDMLLICYTNKAIAVPNDSSFDEGESDKKE